MTTATLVNPSATIDEAKALAVQTLAARQRAADLWDAIRAYHLLLHSRARAFKACGDASARKCTYCEKWERDLIISGTTSVHRACKNANALRRYHARKETV